MVGLHAASVAPGCVAGDGGVADVWAASTAVEVIEGARAPGWLGSGGIGEGRIGVGEIGDGEMGSGGIGEG